MRILNFMSSERGNVLTVFALSAMVLIGLTGAAVDYSGALKLKNKLANATDAALLSVAKVDLNGTDREAQFNIELLANLGVDVNEYNLTAVTLAETETLNSVELEAVVKAEVANKIITALGFDITELAVTSRAVEEKTDIEVSLVLDISSSMAGTKLTQLKDATKKFIDTVMFEDGVQNTQVSVAMIPYGGSVKLPSEIESTVTIDGDASHWAGGTWNGCLQYDTGDFNDNTISGGTFDYIPQHWKWNNGNWWCPQSVLIPQTTDVTKLKNAVDAFSLSDGTGTDHGILWGLKMLSPDWANVFSGGVTGRPAAYSSDTIKVMLVMTDGGITSQFTPNDSTLSAGSPAYKTNSKEIYNKSAAQSQFHSICDVAKANGVTIYTVGVEVNKSWALQDMEDCATSASHYFDVTGSEMEETFKTIAASINTPRLTH